MKRRCPVCHKTVREPTETQSEEGRLFPFCSEQCKLIDLGAWLNADYRIVAEGQSQESEKPSDAASPLPKAADQPPAETNSDGIC